MKSNETTPLLIDKITLPHWSEYIQPTLMAVGSAANLVGGVVAMYLGGHLIKQDDPTLPPVINPFFFVAAATSGAYCMGNIFAIGRIAQRRACTWAQMEDQRRQATELRGVKIGK